MTAQSPNASPALPTIRQTMTIHNVGVYGATGYTGQTLLSLLAKHPAARVAFATSESSRETVGGLNLLPIAEAPLDQVGTIFLCLPHGVSGEIAAKAAARGVRVIDLSADLRLDTPDLYKTWYGHDHPAPHLLPAVYGLSEVYGGAIKTAQIVANPGCHVTAVLLALYPLARARALTGDPIIADTKTGISGAGKALKLDSLFVEVYGDVRPYKPGRNHRHVPEMEQELHKWQADAGSILFTPHVVPVDVGLLATVYVRLKGGWSLPRIMAAFRSEYEGEPLIDLLPEGTPAPMKAATHTNKAVIGVAALEGDTLIVTSAIDNLRKGAASQTVQNFNLMSGLPTETGLL